MADRPTADGERVLILECRLEQLRSQLEAARAEADYARARLAEAAAHEAEHARRQFVLHEELAQARAEVAALHRRLDRSESLRAGLEGHLFEAGARTDVDELVRLRREVLAERHRSLLKERALAQLRGRVEELLSSRESVLARVAQWQRLVREDATEAADLAECLSELRGEIIELERRTATGERREAALSERLARAGFDPAPEPDDEAAAGAVELPRPVPFEPLEIPRSSGGTDESYPAIAALDASIRAEPSPPSPRAGEPERAVTDALVAALASADVAAVRSELLLLVGRTSRDELLDAIRPSTEAAEPPVRAAAYEALSRLLEGDPGALEAQLRAGLADADARVRRRVALVAATARGLTARSLLGPLRFDPDPQVRRLVTQVLRHASPVPEETDPRAQDVPLDLAPSGTDR